MPMIRISSQVHGDLRFDRLAKMAGLLSRWDAVGRMIPIWNACAETGNPLIEKEMCDLLFSMPQISDKIVLAGLAVDRGVFVAISGWSDHCSWIKKARDSGKAGAKHGVKGGRPKAKKGSGLETPYGVILGQNEKPPMGLLKITPSEYIYSSSESSEEGEKGGLGENKNPETPYGVISGHAESQEKNNSQNDFTFPGEQVRNSSPPAKPKPKPKQPTGEHQAIIAEYFLGFEAKYGSKPDFGPDDAKLVSALLKSHGFEQFRRKLFIAFEQTPEWPPSPWDMKQIKVHWNRLVEARTLPAKKLSFDSPIDYVAIGTPGRAMK